MTHPGRRLAPAAGVLVLFMLVSCGGSTGRESGSAGIDPAPGLVRHTFEDRVGAIEAAIPLTTQVDTAFGALHITGWFASGLPVRIEAQEIQGGRVESYERWWYDEQGVVFASVSDQHGRIGGAQRHAVMRIVFGPDRRVLAGESLIDEEVMTRVPAGTFETMGRMELSMESDYRRMLTGRLPRR